MMNNGKLVGLGNIPVKKNDEIIVDIIDNGFEGEGIAKVEGYTVFVSGTIKGEKCKVLILKTTTSHAFAKVIEIIEPSKYRCVPDCETYQRCGGCNLRHMEYEETLNIKRDKVQNLVNKMLKENVQVLQTWAMGNPYNYRNKAIYPIGLGSDGKLNFGVFAKRTHTIIPIKECFIQKEISYEITKFILTEMEKFGVTAYNEEQRQGLIRHIIVKVGIQTGEIMVIFVVNGNEFKAEHTIANNIIDRFPEVKTVVKNINTSNTNVIMGKKNETLVGRGYITDRLGDYIFKISPMSFYQVNPVQAEVLYNIAIESANILEDDIVCDLYCGIGTIGIFASKYAKKVYGIEIIPQAIEDARANAKLNKINNIDFICGDVESAFQELIKKEKVVPNVVIVDPPRKGLDENTINNILKLNVEKVVYISCNPATMVRDLKLMEEKYSVKKIQPVDLFPFTSHVECVALMEHKES